MEPAPDEDYDYWDHFVYDHDDAQSMPEEPSGELEKPPPATPKQKNTRGRSKQIDITKMKRKGKKMKVEYNNFGQCWGKGVTAYVTRLGAWMQLNIPLRDISWPKVDEELKNILWNEIKTEFDLPEEARRKTILKARDIWRDWKNTLAKDIYEFKDAVPHLLEKPPRLYEDIIDEKEWKEFVASSLSPNWAAKRKKAQENRAKNVYLHSSERGDMRMVEEQIEKELGHQLNDIYRFEVWKRLGRKKKDEANEKWSDMERRLCEVEEHNRQMQEQIDELLRLFRS
uniref:Uncharacterized protein n=1 Tax=Cannabis sativa TaxID=3483 RepID=A0A803PVM9_CANSA